MNDFFLILFISVYFLLEAAHDFYVIRDVTNHFDYLSPERKAYHLLSVLQATILFLFLGAIIFWGLHFNIEPLQFAAVTIFIRWISLDNALNLLRGVGIFYVEKTNFFARTIHKFSNFIGIPAEITMLCLKLLLLILIILL